MQELDDYINKVKHLPPAPKILPELLSLLRRENVDSSKVVTLMSYDPALTADVLKACNSAFYSPANPLDDLRDAVQWLGFKEMYRIAAAVSGAKALGPAQTGYGIDTGELWHHSVATAVASQIIAQKLGEDESVVFTAGLLHDIGKIVLSQALEQIYAKLLEETERNQQSLLDTEKKLLGVQHAEIGGRLLARWKFPANLVSAVWFHHSPKTAQPNHRLASMVYLGNLVAHFMGHSYGHSALALRGRVDALETLNLTADQLPHFMIEAHERMAEVESMFKMAAS